MTTALWVVMATIALLVWGLVEHTLSGEDGSTPSGIILTLAAVGQGYVGYQLLVLR